MTQTLHLKGKRLLIDDSDVLNVTAFEWSLRWTRDGAMAYCYSLGVYLHRWLVGATRHERVKSLNNNYLDCRRANIKLYRFLKEDIDYILWLQDNGWFTQRRWNASISQLRSVAAELDRPWRTIQHIATRTYFMQEKEQTYV